jgi:hypothetical protein
MCHPKRYYLLLITVISVLALGCGSPPAVEPTPLPTAAISPREIAQRAGAKMLTAQALHFAIELSGRLTYLDSPPTLALKHAEGDVVRPDQVRAMVKMSTMGVISQVAVIGLGDDQYITNPMNQGWERLSAEQGWYFNPSLLFDPERGIESIIRDTDWSHAKWEEGASGDDHRLHGSLPGERIAPLTFHMVTSGEVAIDIWVQKADDFVRQIEIVELDSDPEDPTRWLIELSEPEEAVEIEPPPIP